MPLYPADYEEKKKLKLGVEYEVEVRIPRNIGFHRKFFALLNVGWANTSLDMPSSPSSLRGFPGQPGRTTKNYEMMKRFTKSLKIKNYEN